MAAFILAGALSWIGRWYRQDGSLTPEQIADQAVALILNGLLRREPAATVKKQRATASRAAVKKQATTQARRKADKVGSDQN
jgi:hypothetical protein